MSGSGRNRARGVRLRTPATDGLEGQLVVDLGEGVRRLIGRRCKCPPTQNHLGRGAEPLRDLGYRVLTVAELVERVCDLLKKLAAGVRACAPCFSSSQIP